MWFLTVFPQIGLVTYFWFCFLNTLLQFAGLHVQIPIRHRGQVLFLLKFLHVALSGYADLGTLTLQNSSYLSRLGLF